jgi:hypothetical protein
LRNQPTVYMCELNICSKQDENLNTYGAVLSATKEISKISFAIFLFYISNHSVPKKNGLGGACGTRGAYRVIAGKL